MSQLSQLRVTGGLWKNCCRWQSELSIRAFIAVQPNSDKEFVCVFHSVCKTLTTNQCCKLTEDEYKRKRCYDYFYDVQISLGEHHELYLRNNDEIKRRKFSLQTITFQALTGADLLRMTWTSSFEFIPWLVSRSRAYWFTNSILHSNIYLEQWEFLTQLERTTHLLLKRAFCRQNIYNDFAIKYKTLNEVCSTP